MGYIELNELNLLYFPMLLATSKSGGSLRDQELLRLAASMYCISWNHPFPVTTWFLV